MDSFCGTTGFAAEPQLPAVHRNHNLATPSVATDGERLFAWFGTGQLVALDTNGGLLWERHLGRDYGAFDVMWGHGSSPVLYRDLLILLFDHPSGGHLVALDTDTGRERWAVDRGMGLRSYSTPVVVSHDGRDELIINTSLRVEGWDPDAGTLRWHAGFPVETGHRCSGPSGRGALHQTGGIRVVRISRWPSGGSAMYRRRTSGGGIRHGDRTSRRCCSMTIWSTWRPRTAS